MSTTISNAILTVTVAAAVTLGNKSFTIDNTFSIANINECANRIVTVPISAEQTVMTFGTTAAAGQLIASNVKCVIIVNRDDTNFARLRIKKTGADTADLKIPAGGILLLWNTSISAVSNGASFATFSDADTISAQADTAPVDLEFYVASL